MTEYMPTVSVVDLEHPDMPAVASSTASFPIPQQRVPTALERLSEPDVSAAPTPEAPDQQPQLNAEQQAVLDAVYRSAELRGFICRAYLGFNAASRDGIDDFEQSFFERLARQLARHDDIKKFLNPGFIYVMARNLTIDQHRMRRAREARVFIEPDEDMHSYGGEDLRLGVIEQEIDFRNSSLAIAYQGLTAAHRAAVAGVALHGKTLQEVADELGVPRGTVKSRLFYGLRALREALETGTPAASS